MFAPGPVRFPPLLPGVFVSRPNRFLVHAAVGGRTVEAACGDPGRLVELLQPGVPLLLAPCAADAVRRTRYTVVLARQRRTWVSVQPVLANRVFAAAVGAGKAAGLSGWRVVGREVRHGRSRFDFQLTRRGGAEVLAEVKSVSLVDRGRALFPDAPTARGTRHVRELTAYRAAGGEAMIVFVVQRPDARLVSPYAAIDPALTAALQDARRAGVRLAAYNCRIGPSGSRLHEPIPVVLP